MSDDLSAFLAPPGKAPGVGPEIGESVSDGVSKYVSLLPGTRKRSGSTRYVAYSGGKAVSVLQIVSRDGRRGVVANVYTIPSERRRGWARLLLAKARRDFRGGVEHAPEHLLSKEGRAWREGVG